MKSFIKGIAIIVILIVGLCLIYEDYWYRKAVPENIGLSHRISIGSDSDFMFSGCGVAVYRLENQKNLITR